MAGNNSLVGEQRQISDRVISVQILVIIFLCINLLLILTFVQKECFYTTARYILFAVTLLSDSLLLCLSDILFIFAYFNFTLPVWFCIIISFVVLEYVIVTPVTLAAMTLERYVAICMPLRHGELCSTHKSVHCVLIIHCLSFVPVGVVLLTFFASAPSGIYRQNRICSVEIFILYRWQAHVRSAIQQFYFLVMSMIIVLSYVKIMKVAKAASGENKKPSKKGLRTVVLHGFQLLLCLIKFWCPFIEATVLQINFSLFINVRFFNYIMFNLVPRCLSPLIYGLMDETFFHVLKIYVSFGFYRINA